MHKSKNIKEFRNNKGITLIALVITIIILIILAGVSINVLFNDEGLIEKATKAKENMEIAQVEEQELLNTLGDKLENWEGNKNPTIKPGESGYPGGNYDDPYIPIGFTHVAGTTWNNGYTIIDGLENEFVWVPCVTETNISKIKDGDNVEIFKKTLPTTTATTDSYYKYNKNNLTITGDKEPASAIKTSVGTYGGFYIAKYEAGVPVDAEENEIAPTSAVPTQKARSVSGATVWTNITRANAITAAQNMIDESSGVKSGLISGECWDTTLQWMVNTSNNSKNEPNAGYDVDSTGNGWYGQSDKTTTGKYSINNIYDMAGNVYEWTTENSTLSGTSYLVYRGGKYNYSGSDYPASHRSYNDVPADSFLAFRVVLYKQ